MAKPRKPYYRAPSPGMGCAGVEDGDYPGQHPGGWYRPPPEPQESSGACEAMIPHDPYGESTAPRRMPKSISGKY